MDRFRLPRMLQLYACLFFLDGFGLLMTQWALRLHVARAGNRSLCVHGLKVLLLLSYPRHNCLGPDGCFFPNVYS